MQSEESNKIRQNKTSLYYSNNNINKEMFDLNFLEQLACFCTSNIILYVKISSILFDSTMIL
jgi:hypothetical protein